MLISISDRHISSLAVSPSNPDQVVVVSNDRVLLLDLHSGGEIWNRSLELARRVVFSENRLLVTTRAGQLGCLDPTTGKRGFLTGAGEDIEYVGAAGAEAVVVGRTDGWVELRSACDGSLVRAVRLDARVSGLVVQGSRILVSTITGYLWAMDLLLETKTAVMELPPGASVLAANDEVIFACAPYVLFYLGWTAAGLRCLETKADIRGGLGLALPEGRWALCTWRTGGPASLGILNSKGDWITRCRDRPALSIFALAQSGGRILAGAATGQLIVWKPRLAARSAERRR